MCVGEDQSYIFGDDPGHGPTYENRNPRAGAIGSEALPFSLRVGVSGRLAGFKLSTGLERIKKIGLRIEKG